MFETKDDLRKQLQGQQARMKEAEELALSCKAQADQLRADLDGRVTEIKGLGLRIADMERRRTEEGLDARKESNDLRESIREAQRKLGESESHNANLLKTLKSQTSQVDTVGGHASIASSKAKEFSDRLDEMVKDKLEADARADQLLETIRMRERAIDALDLDVGNLRRRLEDTKAELDTKAAALEDAEREAAVKGAKADDLERKTFALQKKLEETDDELNRVRTDLSNARSVIARLEAEITPKDDEIRRLELANEDARQQLDTLAKTFAGLTVSTSLS